MKFKQSNVDNYYLFADLESYGIKYMETCGKIKSYAHYLQSQQLNLSIFDVDLNIFLQKIFNKLLQITQQKVNYIIYFHNGSGFDFFFILPEVYKFYKAEDVKVFWAKNKDIYYIQIKHRIKKKISHYITFACSYLIFRTSIQKMGESVGLKKIEDYNYEMVDEKGKLVLFAKNSDYLNHENGLSYKYLQNDVLILQKYFYAEKGINYDSFKLTNGSTAMQILKYSNEIFEYQHLWLTKKTRDGYDQNYTINLWNTLKGAHRGGFCYVNPKYQLKLLKGVNVYDVNSLYPAIMKYMKLPYGYPSWRKNKDYTYEFYEVEISKVCTENIPFFENTNRLDDYIKLKSLYEQKKHMTQQMFDDVAKEKYTKCLNNIALMMDSYQLSYFKKHYKGTYKTKFFCSFKEKNGMFSQYLKTWENLKIKYSKQKNEAGRGFAKTQALLPNGKFGQTIFNKITEQCFVNEIDEYLQKLQLEYQGFYFKVEHKEKYNYVIQYIAETGQEFARAKLKQIGNIYYFSLFYEVNKKPNFLPIAISILSQARIQLFELINKHQDVFIYADTDSVHLLNKKINNKYIDDNEFGKWKFEGRFLNAIYRRPKHYLHQGIIDKDGLRDDNFYELKGGGFDVTRFNLNRKITLQQYLQESFLVKNGKKIKVMTENGPIIGNIDYKFTMPQFYYDLKKQ